MSADILRITTTPVIAHSDMPDPIPDTTTTVGCRVITTVITTGTTTAAAIQATTGIINATTIHKSVVNTIIASTGTTD